MIGEEVPNNIPAKFHMVTLCLTIIRIFSFLCCAKTCKNSAKITGMLNVPNFKPLPLHQEQHVVVRFHYLFKKKKKKTPSQTYDSYERSVQWTGAHRASASPKQRVGDQLRPLLRQWWVQSVRCLRMMILIAMTENTRRYFANHREKYYSFSFLSCNFGRGVRLHFHAKCSYRHSFCVIGLIFSQVM